MNKSSLKSKALMNEFNNIIRGATSNEIIIDNNITSERQHNRKNNNNNIGFESAFDNNNNINTIIDDNITNEEHEKMIITNEEHATMIITNEDYTMITENIENENNNFIEFENSNVIDENDIVSDEEVELQKIDEYEGFNLCYWNAISEGHVMLENIADEEIEFQHENDILLQNDNLNIFMFKELDLMKIDRKSLKNVLDCLIQNCYDKIHPEDFDSSLSGQLPIIPNPKLTKGDFTVELGNYFKMVNLNESYIPPLLKILKKYFPFANLPMKISKMGNIIPKLEEYYNSKIVKIEIDCCINSCIVYTGKYSEYWYCPTCNQQRYTYCKRCKSDFRKIYQCNCNDRTALKTIQYRSIKSLIINLMHYDSFRKLINYEYFDMQNYFDRNQKHWDIKTSEVYKKNYDEMRIKFNQYCFDNKNYQLKMVNIMLSQFYDGCAVYRSKVSSFHPLMITVLNLPPNYRFKVGVGMFALTIFSLNSKSIVEDYLFNNLYVEELLMLNEGFEKEINDVTYFIQVRQIQGIFDTIAAQDKLKIQSSGSLAGCGLCNAGKGKRFFLILFKNI